MLQNIQRNLVLIYVGGFDSLRVGLLLVEQIGQEVMAKPHVCLSLGAFLRHPAESPLVGAMSDVRPLSRDV